MAYMQPYREKQEWDPLDYIAYSLHLIEEKNPEQYVQLHQHRLHLSIRPSKGGSNYSWKLMSNGNREIMQGIAPITKDDVNTLPGKINKFLKNCGFSVDESSGFIQ